MMNETAEYKTVGRRKESVAAVRLFAGSGQITVNQRPYEQYFLRETDRIIVRQPLAATNSAAKFDIIAGIKGGGPTGQAGALKLAIARALILIEPELKDALRKQGFLTRDPRMKERKKYGLKGARKRFQWTKR